MQDEIIKNGGMLTCLESLNKYITILFVEDEKEIRDLIKISLEQEGYESIWCVEKAEDAINLLDKTNILLADYELETSEIDGLKLIEFAKEKYKDLIHTILFSGNSIPKEEFNKLKSIGAAAFLEKPIRTDHLKLWLDELSRRIWIQQILDNDPDEMLIRAEDGTILFVSKEKERIFGPKLIGDKCYLRFEKGLPPDQLCVRCPSSHSIKTEYLNKKYKHRTEWDYETRGKLEEHKTHQSSQSVELVSAPLLDILKKPRAIIEIARDITIRKLAERIIEEMEKETDWIKIRNLFIDGFTKLSIPRAEFYYVDIYKENTLFRLIDHVGNYGANFNSKASFRLEDDKTMNLLIECNRAIIFKVDSDNDKYELEKVANNLFSIGKNHAKYFDGVEKKEWIDIPISVGGKIVGKVTIDGWDSNDIPDSYDIEILERDRSSAGYILNNAKDRWNILQRDKLEKIILDITNKITRLPLEEGVLQEIVKIVCETMNVRICSLFVLDEEENIFIKKQGYGKTINNEIIIENSDESIELKLMINVNAEYRNNLDTSLSLEKNIIGIKHFSSIINTYKDLLGERIYNCIYIPLKVGEKTIGLLRAINKCRPNDFGDNDFNNNDLEIFRLLAGQIAIAIQNAALFEKVRESEKKAEEARDRFKSLFEKSPDGIVIIDPNGPNNSWSIWNCNEAFCKMNKHHYDFLVDKLNPKDIDILNLKSEPRDKYYERLKNNEYIITKVPHKRGDETKIMVQSSSCLIELDGKEYVLGVDRDITELDRLDDIIQAVTQFTVLGEYEKTLEEVIKGMAKLLGCDIVTLFIYDEATGLLRHAPAIAGNLRYPDRTKILEIVPQYSIVRKMLNNKGPYIINENIDEDELFRNLRFTNEEGIKALIALPLLVKEMKVGVMFINYRSKHYFNEDERRNIELLTNLTAMAFCNAQLFDQRTVSERQLRARTALGVTEMLGARLAHEAGYMVDEIKMITENIEQKRGYSSYTKEHLEQIKNKVDDYNNIVRNNIEALSAEPQSISVHDLLNKCINQLKSKNNNIVVLNDFRASKNHITTNPVLFEEIINNLVRNAVTAMDRQITGEKQLSIVTQNVGNNLEIRLKDTGPIIPSEYAKNLFTEPIIKKKGESGFGIGCALAGLFAEANNGSIKIENNLPGKVEILMQFSQE